MSTKLFHSIYSCVSKLGCDRPRKNLLEEIKNKIRKIDIVSAIYINIKVVTTTNSKIGLQRSLQNLMLDFSKKKNPKSVKNSAQKMILNLVFLFHSTVRTGNALCIWTEHASIEIHYVTVLHKVDKIKMAGTSRDISSVMTSAANNYNTRLYSTVRIKTRIRTEVT